MSVLFILLIGLFFIGVNIAVVAFVAVRLLNVRFTFARVVIAATLSQTAVQYLLIPVLFQDYAAGPDPRAEDVPSLLALLVFALACAPLAAMVILVVWEAILPVGSIPPIRTWLSNFRARMRRSRRYFKILRLFSKHRLTGVIRGRNDQTPQQRAELAVSLRTALDEAGVTFVKLGQLLSTRRDILPAVYVDELAKLQDGASPVPYEEVRIQIENSLRAPVAEVFREFDPEPLAAASIAQVHSARLATGEKVVVKVQRPGIRDTVERDLDIVQRLASKLERHTDWGRDMGARKLAEGFAESLREELDFHIECGNLAAVHAATTGRGSPVHVPRAFPELSSGDVLVMERFDGVSLSQAGPDLAGRGLDSSAIAGVLVGELLDEIMVDGIFHTDPHPGNILVLGDGSLGFIDFGSVGRLDRELRESLQRILFALDSQDVYSLSDGLLEVTTRPDDLDQVEFERALGGFMARFLNVAGQPDMRMFNELIRLVMKFRLSVPNELAAVFRSLGTIEGSATALDPRFDLVHHAKSYGEQYAQKLVDGDALRERVQSEMIAALPIAKRFVRRVDRIAGAVESGRLTVNIRLFADAKERNVVTSWLNQILLTVLAATTGVMGVLLIRVPDGPAMTSSIGLYDFAGFILLFISSVMALRVLVGIFAAGRHREDSY